MPLRNRVTPLGDFVAAPERGLVYGNRGCLHNDKGEIWRSWNGRRWISCQLEFRGRHREDPLSPGRYTGLFFLDEATAFAAGHRPCAECRHEDFVRFRDLVGARNADAIDAQLHVERRDLERGGRRYYEVNYQDIPDGAFVQHAEGSFLVLGENLLRWTPGGYAYELARPAQGTANVITPPIILGVLASGWNGAVPFLHPSSRSRG